MDATVIFDPSTGRIKNRIIGQPHAFNLAHNVPPGQAAIEADESVLIHTHYIHNNQPTPRPASPISRSGLTLNNVPTGSTLFIDGTAYPVQGTVDLSFPLPGTYALRVECFPYLDWTDEVTV